MLYQGIHLLDRFAQDDRVHILQPRKNLQIKFTRTLPNGNDFVVQFPTVAGRTYEIDDSPDLTAASWTAITNSIAGNGAVQQYRVLGALANGQRFYWVLVLP